MKKRLLTITISTILILTLQPGAAAVTHTVQKGESLWKIAVKYKMGISEIFAANSQIPNFDLIYPNQKIEVPLPDQNLQAIVNEVVRLTNQKRTANGLKPLTENWELSRIAQYKSNEMRDKNYFSHQSPAYGTPFEMLKKFGIKYSAAGENIAKGQKTAAEVVDSWWNSPGHKQNMLNPNFTQIGIGNATPGNYWTQIFTG